MPPCSLTSRLQDLPNDDPLAGIELQRACEAAAYRVGGSNWNAPAQLVGDFLAGRASKCRKVKPTYPLGVTWTAMTEAIRSISSSRSAWAFPYWKKVTEATTVPMPFLRRGDSFELTGHCHPRPNVPCRVDPGPLPLW